MISLRNISKKYGNNIALDSISLDFREREFVAILGESGSGKSTLLNIIGGLDRYDSGELFIKGINAVNYKDRDWDNYREKKLGFIFQGYNLIEHLNVLENVKSSLLYRKRMDKNRVCLEILEALGIKGLAKRNVKDLSGGEKQRVAIARALVKDPEVLLCDEPTGALDSKNGMEIMKLLKGVSKNKLVIMVTHSEELAKKYADRIIRIKDGIITYDSNEYKTNVINNKKIKSQKRRLSISEAIKLSYNNLRLRKRRTLLVSIAGSIGIIGIALIISLSNGVKEYINKEEKNTFSYYPIEINKQTINYSNIDSSSADDITCKDGKICTKDDISNSNEVVDTLALKNNNLIKLKKYLDDNIDIKKYSNINYNYNLELNIYSTNYNKVNPTSKTFTNNVLGTNSNTIFREINITNRYDLLAGSYPKKYNDLVLVVDKDNKINMSLLYYLDIEDINELNRQIKQSNNKLVLDNNSYDYNELLNKEFKLVLNTSFYDKNNSWFKINDENRIKKIIDDSISIRIVGIIKDGNGDSSYVGYNKDLLNFVVDNNKKSDIYMDQVNNPEIDVLTNRKFENITYNDRLLSLGGIDYDNPESIEIYPNSFDAKKEIKRVLKEYNEKQLDKDKISYTDILDVLLETITAIINIISYILIALVAISLIVSSIMIAIVTHISVLERTKEIGILRSIGAAKKDITRLFLGEKLIEGFLAGGIGIVIARLLIIPTNILIEKLVKISNLAHINYRYALSLLLVSIIVTIISGLIPARKAAKISVVDALRNE